MRNYSFHWGKLLVVRWLVVSWTLQAIHVLDKREQVFRIILELLFVVIFTTLAVFEAYSWWSFFYQLCCHPYNVLVIRLHMVGWIP